MKPISGVSGLLKYFIWSQGRWWGLKFYFFDKCVPEKSFILFGLQKRSIIIFTRKLEGEWGDHVIH